MRYTLEEQAQQHQCFSGMDAYLTRCGDIFEPDPVDTKVIEIAGNQDSKVDYRSRTYLRL